jgi:hypothetical protein
MTAKATKCLLAACHLMSLLTVFSRLSDSGGIGEGQIDPSSNGKEDSSRLFVGQGKGWA